MSDVLLLCGLGCMFVPFALLFIFLLFMVVVGFGVRDE